MPKAKNNYDIIRGMNALVIDDQAGMRQLLKTCLYSLGISLVVQAASGEEAARLLAREKFDLVLCDYNLGEATDGQQLLEYVRSKGLVSDSVIWFMVTAEVDVRSVSSAGEVAPDAYLLKPFSEKALEDRLFASLALKSTLRPIVTAMESNDLHTAIALTQPLIDGGGRFALDAMRLKTQCLLLNANWSEVKAVCTQALAVNDRISWAELGMAKALRAQGKLSDAKACINVALQHRREFAQGWDLLVDTLLEEGHQDQALKTALEAAAAVPSARRHRSVAVLAAANGNAELAVNSLERVVAGTRNSLTRLAADTGLLARAFVDAGRPERALATLAAAPREFLEDKSYLASKASAECRAHARMGNRDAASLALGQVRELAGRAAEMDSEAQLALAQAAFDLGDTPLGEKLVVSIVGNNHERLSVVASVRTLLTRCGMGSLVDKLVDEPVAEIVSSAAASRKLLSEGKLDEAIEFIEQLATRLPANRDVLLSATQVYLVAMRRKGVGELHAERMHHHLSRLQTLAPGNSRLLLVRAAFKQLLSKEAAA
jgi:DNA-binding NarL/FixJ family response regulator